MADINQTIEALGRAHEEFKSTIDQRIAQLESKGSVDVVTEEKFTALKGDLLKLQGEVTDFQKKANRLGGQDTDTAQAEYRAAYTAWMRKGERAEADLEAKAATAGVATDGGYLVPRYMADQITQRVVQLNPLRSLCTVVSVSGENVQFIHNRKGVNSGWVAETASRPATNTSVLQEIKPTFGEIYANPQASQKIIDDAAFDVEAWIASDVAEEFARAEGAAFVTGDGTDKPSGFLTGTPVVTPDATRAAGVLQYVASGSAGALPTNVQAYYKLVYSLKSDYRNGASFVCNSATLAALMSLLDADNRPLWQPSLQVGQPSTFIGQAVNEVQDMPDVGANTFPLAFGNWKAGYLIADRVGIRTLRDPYSNKPFIGFYSTKRVGGITRDSEAIKLLKASAS